MRAALLPAGPDPYLLAYWLRNYATWADAVDQLDIIVCAQNDPEMRAFMEARVAAVPHASVTFYEERTDHGVVIDALVKASTADLVVLCEDDAFVQQPGVMAECFERIESGVADLVGTPRGYSSYEIMDRARELWGDAVKDGPAFSPAFLFARRKDLARVKKEGNSLSRFSSTRWPVGKRIASLKTTVTGPEQWVGDTFVAASLQLRAMGLRCELRPAYRTVEAQPDGPWFHVGSLSDGYGWAFYGGKPEHDEMVAQARYDPTDWYKRVAWWTRVASVSYDGSDHHMRYRFALMAFVSEAGLSRYFIDRAGLAITPLVTWAES